MNALEIQKNAKIINKFIGLWLILFVFGVLSHFFFKFYHLGKKNYFFSKKNKIQTKIEKLCIL